MIDDGFILICIPIESTDCSKESLNIYNNNKTRENKTYEITLEAQIIRSLSKTHLSSYIFCEIVWFSLSKSLNSIFSISIL